MGSMQSESKTIYSKDTFFSEVEFSFKGKGIARLMSREMHNGTIISLNDSTVSNIDFKKKKYSIKTFDEILKKKEKNDDEIVNQDNTDDENVNGELNEFFISKEPELINGFEVYKITIRTKRKKIEGTSNTTEFGNKTSTTFEAQEKTIIYSNYIWFSKTLREPDFVIKIKNEISEFQNSWADMSIDLTEYGIDKDSIIVKMSTENEDGNFNFDLISFQKFSGDDEELKVPEDYKKVRKL
jgi:hypothetical protein